jgi:hypothetical protein
MLSALEISLLGMIKVLLDNLASHHQTEIVKAVQPVIDAVITAASSSLTDPF